jgi:predicted RecA/RadA family phage recombinase
MNENEFCSLAGDKIVLVLDPKDNVAVALTDLKTGDCCVIGEGGEKELEVTVAEDIAFGHKFALIDMEKDTPIYKYGEEIGRTKACIKKGDWIHIHNLYCDRGMK